MNFPKNGMENTTHIFKSEKICIFTHLGYFNNNIKQNAIL